MEHDYLYAGLEPAELWRHFAALNRIPRQSVHEAAAREYVREVAQAAGAEWVSDERGNALARVKARAGSQTHETIAVQTHLDMVCDSAPGIERDFARDPIVPVREGDRISAEGTTLGADNGIGVAAALALLTEPEIAHVPLELLFTVEEEIGLLGALNFDMSLLGAQALINLDSEDDGALTIGSAGGSEIVMRLPLDPGSPPADWVGAELRVAGLAGGHSGVQIHERRANAIKLLAEILDRLLQASVPVRLVSAQAGTAHNAIPREAGAQLAIERDAMERVAAVVAGAVDSIEHEWHTAEPGLAIRFEPTATPPATAATNHATATLVKLLNELPHGVIAMSSRFPDTVQTSANLALLQTDSEQATVLVSMRSQSDEELHDTESDVRSLAGTAGANAKTTGGYPAWQPRHDSAMVAAAVAAYRQVNGKEPRLDIVHGGLECGVLVASRPDLDAVSFGPLIREAHTPGEHVYASTVATTWRLLVQLIREPRAASR